MGIDPGKSGGIAIQHSDGRIEAIKMLEDDLHLLHILRRCYPAKCYLEVVRPIYPRKGQKFEQMRMSARSSFVLGGSFHQLRMAVAAADLTLREVESQRWQSTFNLRGLGGAGFGDSAARTVKKNAHKAKAQAFFPHFKVTHAIADALLILKYGVMHSEATDDDEAPEHWENPL